MYNKRMIEIKNKLDEVLIFKHKEYKNGFDRGYDLGFEIGFVEGQKDSIEKIKVMLEKAGVKNEQDD